MKQAQRLEDILTSLYDYEHIDLDKFYNSSENEKSLALLNELLYNREPNDDESKILDELYNNINDFIKFETNYNSEIGDFLS